MIARLPMLFVFLVFATSALYVQFRGRVRHKLSRLVADHANLLAPFNTLMYIFSAVRARPFVELREFPELETITEQWHVIRDEAATVFDEGYIRAAAGYNDIGFNTFFKRGWKRFYLKWYGDFLPSAAALCPKTTALLAQVPSVNAAMFALLPPGSRLGAHRDPYAGSLRYHLGLVTPNSPDCCILVDGHKYYWKDGEAVIFDETYIHQAENKTDVTRVILFCDIERPMSNRFMRWMNRAVGRRIARAAATENVPGEPIGALNKVFAYLYQLRVGALHVKQWNRVVYYLLKWLLLAGIVYLIVR